LNIGDKIKENRKKAHITQKDLAKQIDKSERMVQKYESGEVTPSIDIIYKIANALNITFFQLITGKERPDYTDKTLAFNDLGKENGRGFNERDFNDVIENTLKKLSPNLDIPWLNPKSLEFYEGNISNYWKDVVINYPLAEFDNFNLSELEYTECDEIAKALEITFKLKITEIKNNREED